MSTDDNIGKKARTPVRREQNRREFLRTAAFAGGTLVLALAGYAPLTHGGTQRLRPPGAVGTSSHFTSWLR